MRLTGKRLILGVTGSIAAYKAAAFTRLLIQEGADIQVVMSDAAAGFITPLTLSVLSKKPVLSQMISDRNTWNNHVDMGLWADLLVIAPATANTIASIAHGACNNLLHAVYLSARCPVMIAPAMDHDMFKHPATQENLALLKRRGVIVADPVSGELASGLSGEGRMQEPELLLEKVCSILSGEKPLTGKKVLVTAGPTCENIDPVRYISNHSSGKMGLAIARSLNNAGASVYLVSGPLQMEVPAFVKHIPVITSAEMLEACTSLFPDMNAAVMAAAVADYTPRLPVDKKIKKKEDILNIELVKTKDILMAMGEKKKPGQILVGFALETDNELENAREKLKRKNLDMIVLNSMNDKGAGFGSDTNKVTLLFKDNTIRNVPLMTKDLVADEILVSLLNLMHA